MVDGASAVATSVIVATPPAARLPMAHTTGWVMLLVSQLPWVGVALPNVKLYGRASTTETSVASVGPPLVTTIV